MVYFKFVFDFNILNLLHLKITYVLYVRKYFVYETEVNFKLFINLNDAIYHGLKVILK